MNWAEERGDENKVVLSSVIGARSVSLSGIRYVIIHPLMRCSTLHPSGLTSIKDYLASQELIGNMGGRAGRESDGLVTEICMPHTASGHEQTLSDDSSRDSQYILQHLEQYWHLKIWRASIRSHSLRQALPPLPEAALHLVDARYHGVTWSDLCMSPRLAHFVEEANKQGVGLEALRLACVMDCGAASFNPNQIFFPAKGPKQECPLLAFSNILKDLEVWVQYARAVALDQAVTVNSLKIFPNRLFKARALLWKNNKSDQFQSSKLTLETQSQLLIKLLALAIPELVARKSNGNWYCSGFRVRGQALPTTASSGWLLCFNATESPGSSGGADQGQPCLKPTFCLPCPEQPYVATLVCVSDSSVQDDCFLMGLICSWRVLHIFPLWIACKSGGKAADLCTVWSKAPLCNFGLTIYNGNDFRNDRGHDVSGPPLAALYEETHSHCSLKSIFFLNDPQFFPALTGTQFPRLMRAATEELQRHDVQVCDGQEFLGDLVLRDDMHFHVSSTATVVEMYSKVIFEALRLSSVSDKFLSSDPVQESPKLVDTIDSCTASPMEIDPDQISAILNEVHSEIAYLHEVMEITQPRDFSSQCSSVRCPDILSGSPWLRIPFVENYEIRPRIADNPHTWLHPNALDSDGQPSIYYHGTPGLYGLNILQERHLIMAL